VTEDDSRWDEAYNFVLGTNPNFPDNTFTAESAAGLRLNLIMIYDNSGELLFGTRYDAGQARQPIPPDDLALISQTSKLVHHASLTSGVAGNLMTSLGPLLISSHPIRTSLGEGPVVGALIFGRDLNRAEIQRLAGGVLLSTTFKTWTDPALSPNFETARSYLAGSSDVNNPPVFVSAIDNNAIAGYAALKDVNQNDALLLRVDLPRTIFQRGQANVRMLSTYLLMAGFAFGGIVLLLVDMFLIAPVTQLREETRNLGLRGEFSSRIPIRGKNEVSDLAGSYNGLLEVLDLRNQELKQAAELGRRLDQYQGAAYICEKISGILNQQELMERAIELIQERFKLTFAGVYLPHEASGSVKLTAGTGETGKKLLASGFRVPISSLNQVIRTITTHKTLYEPAADASTLGPISSYLPSTRSTLDIPLSVGHLVTGVLSLHSNIPNYFDEGDISVLEGIAGSLSTGLENARLYHEVEDRLDKVQTLHEQYLGEVWKGTAQAAGGLSFSYENEKPDEKTVKTHLLDVPIELRDRVIGRLELEVDRANLSSEEMDLVDSIAMETAVALENTRLLEDTQRRAERERFLAEISNKVRASSDVDSILRTAILELGRSLRASEGYIHLEPGGEIKPDDGPSTASGATL
jgi:sensor domain CHASE-containing protein/GAF domain-containing protein